MEKDNYLFFPSVVPQSPRRDLQNFLSMARRPNDPGTCFQFMLLLFRLQNFLKTKCIDSICYTDFLATSSGNLSKVIGFHHGMLRWCSLHILNLGIDLWAGASCMEMLLEQDIINAQSFNVFSLCRCTTS